MDALKYEDAIISENTAESLEKLEILIAQDVLKITMQDEDIYVRNSAEEPIKRIIRKIR